MPVPRRRHCRSRQGKRRAHYHLKFRRSTVCSKCGETHLPHRVCPKCGTYKDRTYKVVVGGAES